MKIKRSKFLKLIGKKYSLFFGLILVAPKALITDTDLNHEGIHARQGKELLWVFFYLWYGVEWLIRLIQYRQSSYMAYRNISFEREAYQNQEVLNYLTNRPRWAFLKYL